MRCQVCSSVTETKTFSRKDTENEYKLTMNYEFNCNDKCIIYLFTGVKCMLQYVGKTADAFRCKWNNYRMNDRNFLEDQACIEHCLFENFYNEGHSRFLEGVTITFIDKTDLAYPKRQEHYWRHTLVAMAPLALNVENE